MTFNEEVVNVTGASTSTSGTLYSVPAGKYAFISWSFTAGGGTSGIVSIRINNAEVARVSQSTPSEFSGNAYIRGSVSISASGDRTLSAGLTALEFNLP